ncbi:hypothetical protein [Synechococcus sp. UW105]|uniref:hypothetical protein n=1 Tax=Synechococcus sp. UW105 TaxID=337067 RepID=UPI001A7E1209|nr:hypothetical protein [Synechococcus sp. UW105]
MTTHSSFAGTAMNAEDQILELTDEQLELVEGGGKWGRRFQKFRKGIDYLNRVIN